MRAIQRVAVMGIGYVGLTLSVVLAKKKLDVIGIEIDERVLAGLQAGSPHFQEKGLKPLLQHYQRKGNLEFLDRLPERRIDAYIISVGTPLKPGTKSPNLDYMTNVLDDVGSHMERGCTVMLRSTVPVGFTRGRAIPALEAASGLRAGEDFSFVFAPERTTAGKAIVELESLPQIVGGLDEVSLSVAADLFRRVTPTVLTVSGIEAAEMIKIIDNTHRDIAFAYANEIAMVCETLGLDANELIAAANTHYPRNHVQVPSPGVGGACLSKDPHILVDFCTQAGYHPALIAEGRRINERIPAQIVRRLDTALAGMGKDIRRATLFVVGFAFKGEPETSDLRDATTLWFLDALGDVRDVADVRGYDPVVSREALAPTGIRLYDDFWEGCDGADVVLFMNNHRSYIDLDPFRICDLMNSPSIFYDGWRIFEKDLFQGMDGTTYMGVGV
jgi:UDP-N-acetyl-D-mannosaminuronic acid dehydrogenase